MLRNRLPPGFPQHTVRRPAGYMIGTHPEMATEEYDTEQCPHCQAHWQVRPGSGIIRGFCLNCNRRTCGQAVCDPCVPAEKMLLQMEGRP